MKGHVKPPGSFLPISALEDRFSGMQCFHSRFISPASASVATTLHMYKLRQCVFFVFCFFVAHIVQLIEGHGAWSSFDAADCRHIYNVFIEGGQKNRYTQVL